MILIRFPDPESKRRALGFLTGRFSFKSWASGDMAVPENALAHLAMEGISIEMIEAPTLSAERALGIAQADAARMYRDLSLYRIRLELEPDGWHVDYELKAPDLKGGGPHYIIDCFAGAILSRRCDQ
jgi:hypothetical protein